MKLKHLLMLLLVVAAGNSISWAFGIADAPTEWAKALFYPDAPKPQSEIPESPQAIMLSSLAGMAAEGETGEDTDNTAPAEESVIATFTKDAGVDTGQKTWTAGEKNGFVITGISNLKDDGSIKFSKENKLSLTIPEDFTVTSINFIASNNSDNPTDITIGSVTRTLAGKKKGELQELNYTFSQGVQGPATLVITNSTKEAHINSIKVHGFTTRATFQYKGSALVFNKTGENEYATTLEVAKGEVTNGGIQLTVALQGDATISGEDIEGNNITISLESTIGATKTCDYIVTSADKTTETYKITVIVQKQKLVLRYYPDFEQWNKRTEPNHEWKNPELKAFVVNAAGKETPTALPEGIKYESDMASVATVDPTTGVITLSQTGQGGAYIYATLAESEEYFAAEAAYNVVIEDGYKYQVKKGDKAPEPNAFQYIKDDDGNMLVRIKFGGWKRNDHKYTFTSVSGTEEKTDKWNDASDQSGMIAIDRYNYGFAGENNAMDESKALSDEAIYGSRRNGWFKSPEVVDGIVTKSYPFTLPVRGTYVTFEPQMNGTLSVYIIQNGAWNTDSNNKIIPGQFRPHAFQVVNQRGLTLPNFTTDYTVTTKQTITDEYICDRADLPVDENYDDKSKNIAKWKEFSAYLSENEKQQIADKWSSGPHGAQEVVLMDNGSFLAVQKGIVRYTFHVTGHETYYFFSNFSKMGFCGANFVPDPKVDSEGKSWQPTDNIVLEDTKEFPEITKTRVDGEFVPGNQQLPKYKFTIEDKNVEGGKREIGSVTGVQVPQFSTITMKRTFKKDKWNTLTLPFNMTQLKVEEIFGEGTQLILLNSSKLNGDAVRLHFIYHEIQNVLPGYPYLIKPTFKYGKDNCTSKNGVRTFNENNELTQFVVPVKHINPDNKPQVIDCGEYEALGTLGYCKPIEGDKNGYSINYKEGDIFISDGDGKLYVSKGNSYGRGYRSYIRKTDNGVRAAKSIVMTYSGVDDNFDNTTTEISFAELTPEAAMAVGLRGVYNLNGQKVAETVDNLPAGMYIVNGQKVVVK